MINRLLQWSIILESVVHFSVVERRYFTLEPVTGKRKWKSPVPGNPGCRESMTRHSSQVSSSIGILNLTCVDQFFVNHIDAVVTLQMDYVFADVIKYLIFARQLLSTIVYGKTSTNHILRTESLKPHAGWIPCNVPRDHLISAYPIIHV